jgi:hypothetical protein
MERRSLPPALPQAEAAAAEGQLPPAQPVAWTTSLHALDYNTRRHDRGLELREFVPPSPIVELHLEPGVHQEPAGATDALEISMSPHPPQTAAPWLGAPRGFPATPAELGPLARLDFNTIGFAYSDRPANAPAPPPPQTSAPQASAPQASVQVEEPPAPEPVALVAAEPVPDLETRALPLTLHGQAPPRAKFAQAFTSAVVAPSDIQIPPSAVLPLRPIIVFGPAPAAPAPPAAVAPAPAAPAPKAKSAGDPSVEHAVRVPSKPAQAQPAQPKTEARAKTSVIPTPKATPVKQAAAPAASEPKPVVETPQPAPERRTFSTAAGSDADMPSLQLQANQGAWSKLSVGVKIAVAAALIAVLGGIGYVVTRGNGKTVETPVVTQAPAAVATGVPISGGWIEDWANVARSNRRISLLSGSLKLSDYRMEFQAQIEAKAIGWVFRGLNPRNYYVAKLETVKAGLEPTVALVHFAVVDGQDEKRVAVPLPMKLRVDTTYKIRFEAMGTHFSAWVQGQKIDEWTDNRFGSGGVGLFSERDEHSVLQGIVNVVPLVSRN